MPATEAAEPAFRPRPRFGVRVRRVKRVLDANRHRIALTLFTCAFTVFAFGQVIWKIGATTPADVEAGVSATPVFAAGGSAIIWLVLGAGSAALIPAAMQFEPGAPVLKEGAIRRELAIAWQRVRALRARR